MLRPGSTAEVSDICKLATAHRIALVPQGGNTGLVGGQTPHHGEVVVSLRRLNKIREVDTALKHHDLRGRRGARRPRSRRPPRPDRLFPLSLAAEGSCTIGGNLSTNAGGTAALAYGVARDLVLGLEVVLADGRVLNALSKLKKDNTGYDLKQPASSARKARSASSPRRCSKLFPKPRAGRDRVRRAEIAGGSAEAP